jgi:hypothetical protein
LSASICPICAKRRAERYCPAKGEKICAVDCGVGREVTIDCPSDCGYLLAAHRWEEEHAKEVSPRDLPFPEVTFPAALIHNHQELLSAMAYAIVAFAGDTPSLTDSDIFAAAQQLAETYRTLTSGIYFEKPPPGLVASGLYAALARLLDEQKKTPADSAQAPPVTDLEVFHLLVFFVRFGMLRSNGRVRARKFLEFLRRQIPPQVAAPSASRIIIP